MNRKENVNPSKIHANLIQKKKIEFFKQKKSKRKIKIKRGKQNYKPRVCQV